MPPIFTLSMRSVSFLFIASGLILSACASNPDQDRPRPNGERQERPARTSGTFLQPAALLFADMDTNGDKVTSKAEMQASVKAEWNSFDRKPSATQFAQWSQKSLGSTDANPTFMSFDRDFNGVLSETEFTAQFERLFTRFDKNADGVIERSEMIIAFEAPRGRTQQGGQRGQTGGRGQGGGGGRPPR